MTGSDSTVGAVMTSDDVKRRYAQESLGYNCRDKDFVALFPHLVTKHEAAQREAGASGGGDGTSIEFRVRVRVLGWVRVGVSV